MIRYTDIQVKRWPMGDYLVYRNSMLPVFKEWDDGVLMYYNHKLNTHQYIYAWWISNELLEIDWFHIWKYKL